MGNIPPFRRKSNPSTTATTTTTNENLNQTSSYIDIADAHQKDGHSRSNSARKSALKKLHLSKDFLLAIFVRPTLYISVRISYFVLFVLGLCVSFLLALCLIALAYSCILIVSLAMLPMLLVSLLFTRIFQFIRYGKDYKKLTRFKHFLRGWLYIDVIIVLVGLWFFYPFAKFVHSLKLVVVLDLHLTKWVVIITIACVFYLISFIMYQLTHQVTSMIRNIVGNVNIPQAISEIIDGFIFWWAKHEVMKRVPAFQEHELLGLPTRKWLRTSILVLIGYNLITLFTHLTVLALRHVCQQCSNTGTTCASRRQSIWQNLFGNQLHTKFVVHFANGMRLSISFIMNSVLLLLTWGLYFGTRLDMEVAVVQRIWELGKWTFTSVLICSFLWLIKSFVLLTWEVNTVYLRLEPKIKSISEQLYFLGNLGYDKKLDFFELHQRQPEDQTKRESVKGAFFANCIRRISKGFTSSQYFIVSKKVTNKLVDQKRERVKNELLMDKNPTVDDLRRATRYFLTAHKYLQKKKYIAHILSNLEHCCDRKTWMELNDDCNEELSLRMNDLKKILTFDSGRNGSDSEEQNTTNDEPKPGAQSFSSSGGNQCNEWNRFAELVGIDPEGTIPPTVFQKWVERAHNKCMFLSYTLTSAHEVGITLNKIFSWLLIGATFIMWLLLSGLATTQVLVLIASPLLAATFIFGESCKTLFEGILFVYVIHPFDVGDLCVIEKNMMVVTAIDIWKTTFSEVDKQTREVVIYPNVELSTKVILNHRTKFQWSDCLEFSLDALLVQETYLTHEKLIQHFMDCLKDKIVALLSSSPILTIVTKDDSVKLVIRLKYKAETTKGWTYSECFCEKERLRATFYLAVKDIIRNFKLNSNSSNVTNDTPLK